MISPPVETVFGPIVITPTGPWLVLELETVSYEAETPDVKGQLVAQLAGWAAVAESDFQILRVSREWNGAEYVENLRRHMPRRAHRDLYRELLNRQQQVLEAMAATTSVVFLCVRLADPATDLHQKARGLFDQSPRELAARAREALRMTQLGSLEPARLSELYRRAAAAWDLAYQWLQCQPARTDQIQWLIYRNFCRSLGEPFIPGLDQPQAVTAAYRFEPTVVPEKGNVLRWLLEHGVERHPRHLKVTSELGDSYQAGLCVGEIKQDAELFTPAAELMFSALDLPFRVDASLSLKYVQNEVALRRWERVIAKSREQTREEEEQTGGDAKTASVRRVGLAHEAHEELAKSGAPHLEGTLSLLIGAPSAEELRKRVEHARRAFPWPLHRPHGDQLELWLSHFPGQHFRPVGYQRVWMCDQVGAMVPQAARQAGARTPSGLYFAHSLRGRHPILMDLREGSDSAKSTLIVLLGSPGGGKSMTLQYLEYLGFVLGARVVDIEAKDDHRAHLLPAVQGHTQEIVIGPGPEHRGKLDPLRVAPFGERQEAGTTFLCELLPKAQSDRLETVVNGAVSRVIRQAGERQAPELACCTEVVRMLHESSNELEREAGYHLSQYRDGGLAQLGFADLKTPLPQASEQWTYINVKALKRAAIATVRSEMTTGERHSRAILQLIALYAMRILDEEPDRLKVLGFDEASFISADAVGEQLINQLSRWGRSKLALPILSTQLSRDVEQEEGLVGQALLFGMRQEAEARAALKLAELDPDDNVLIQNLLTGYGAGRALYRDLHDRHEEIQVDVVDRDLFRGLQTDPAREETFDDFERDAWAA